MGQLDGCRLRRQQACQRSPHRQRLRLPTSRRVLGRRRLMERPLRHRHHQEQRHGRLLRRRRHHRLVLRQRRRPPLAEPRHLHRRGLPSLRRRHRLQQAQQHCLLRRLHHGHLLPQCRHGRDLHRRLGRLGVRQVRPRYRRPPHHRR